MSLSKEMKHAFPPPMRLPNAQMTFRARQGGRPSRKRRKKENFRMSPNSLLALLATSHEAMFFPSNQPKGFVTKSIHPLTISQHTHKMNIRTEFSKSVSHFLIEHIFFLSRTMFSLSLCKHLDFKLHWTWANCRHPTCLSCWIQGLVTYTSDELSLFHEISLVKWANQSWILCTFCQL